MIVLKRLCEEEFAVLIKCLESIDLAVSGVGKFLRD